MWAWVGLAASLALVGIAAEAEARSQSGDAPACVRVAEPVFVGDDNVEMTFLCSEDGKASGITMSWTTAERSGLVKAQHTAAACGLVPRDAATTKGAGTWDPCREAYPRVLTGESNAPAPKARTPSLVRDRSCVDKAESCGAKPSHDKGLRSSGEKSPPKGSCAEKGRACKPSNAHVVRMEAVFAPPPTPSMSPQAAEALAANPLRGRCDEVSGPERVQPHANGRFVGSCRSLAPLGGVLVHVDGVLVEDRAFDPSVPAKLVLVTVRAPADDFVLSLTPYDATGAPGDSATWNVDVDDEQEWVSRWERYVLLATALVGLCTTLVTLASARPDARARGTPP